MDDGYFLAQDNSSHWYVVPRKHEKEWNAWRGLPEDDERSWDAPAFARVVGGSPSLVTFYRPEIA